MTTAETIVTLLLASLFAFAAALKLLKVDQSLQIRDHLGRSPREWTAIGMVELAGVAGLLGVGALASHIRARDGVSEPAAATAGVGLAVVALVLYLTA